MSLRRTLARSKGLQTLAAGLVIALSVAPSALAIGDGTSGPSLEVDGAPEVDPTQDASAAQASPSPEATDEPSPTPDVTADPTPSTTIEPTPTPTPTGLPPRDALEVNSSGRPGKAGIGDRVEYKITVRNTDSRPFEGVTIIDEIPSEMEIVRVGAAAPYSIENLADDPRIVWDIGYLAGGSGLNLTWTGKVVRSEDDSAINRIRVLVDDRNTTTSSDVIEIEFSEEPGGNGGNPSGPGPGGNGNGSSNGNGSGNGPVRGGPSNGEDPNGPATEQPNVAPNSSGPDEVDASGNAKGRRQSGGEMPFTGMPLMIWLFTGSFVGATGLALRLLSLQRPKTPLPEEAHADLVIPPFVFNEPEQEVTVTIVEESAYVPAVEPEVHEPAPAVHPHYEPLVTSDGSTLIYDRLKELSATVQAMRQLRVQVESVVL